MRRPPITDDYSAIATGVIKDFSTTQRVDEHHGRYSWNQSTSSKRPPPPESSTLRPCKHSRAVTTSWRRAIHCVNTPLNDDPQIAVGHPRLSEVDLPLPCRLFCRDRIRIHHRYDYAALPPQRELKPTERPPPLPRLWLLSYTTGQYHFPTFTIAK